MSSCCAAEFPLAEVALCVATVAVELAALLEDVAVELAVLDVEVAVEDAELASVAADEVVAELVAAELAALETCSVLVSVFAEVSAEALTLAKTKPAARANVVAPA
ncbi:hypothetical protein LPPLD21_01746 [Lactiplantibacillus paraplantarum]|uniref:Uncharacterized protein n=1 Tax=Lactiplantibacillus paraplantarum TaxID=60520 RepID=A0ABQ0NAX4_9LACO|nr:hypothetical protein FD48_GL003129 [Lactiplantibacillus paraplantarum DSM 10667]GBF02200.1 hypothetical protein LPPLD21_01746 [Lactiplantibacillus paraplantarum]